MLGSSAIFFFINLKLVTQCKIYNVDLFDFFINENKFERDMLHKYL